MRTTTSPLARIAALAAAVALPLSVAACGSNETAAPAAETTSTMPTTSPASSMSPSPSMSSASMDKPFGEGCAAVPDSGKGSFDGMSTDPVATAASNNPVLSTLVTAVKTAGLVDTLNNAEDITVFAPTDSAFMAMDPATLKKAMKDKELLTSVLTGHVVAGRLAPDELAGEHQTLNKKATVTVTGEGESFTVNDSAAVVCGNVQTANATVYIIDGVLLPSS